MLSSKEKLEVTPELAKLTAKSPVIAGNRQRDAMGKVESYQQLVTQNLTLDVESGDLLAAGPGWVTLTMTPDKLPSTTQLLQPSKPRAETKSDTGLRQLSLNFEKQLQANVHRRELTMHDNIQGWLGVVPRWEDQVAMLIRS